jgi:hypothetical protein
MIKCGTLGGHLGVVDQVRLVELLAGSEAALAMLSRSG